jgi:hypothetical protein
MNAAFHGRPVLIHERDISGVLEQRFEEQGTAFRLLLRIIMLLDKVIGLYRPSLNLGDSGLELEFPSFEEMVERYNSSTIGKTQLGM